MPGSYVRTKVPLDEALNYFLDYYNKAYDKETKCITNDEFNTALYKFLGFQEAHRNQIKNLRTSKYVVYAKTYQEDYELVIRKVRQDEKPTRLSTTQIEILEGFLEYLNTNITDVEKSYNSVLKKDLFPLFLFIILIVMLMIYFSYNE